MKKQTSQREPTVASLRTVPTVDFASYKAGRRNPFAVRMRLEGWELVHEGPATASLRDVPELGADAKGGANPYAGRIKAQGIDLQVGRHRPLRGSEVGPTQLKSVRLPPAVWQRLEKQARGSGVALHALLRVALLEWLDRHAA